MPLSLLTEKKKNRAVNKEKVTGLSQEVGEEEASDCKFPNC